MNTVFQLIVNGILLGVGLAMDAFSVSVANGLKDPNMKKQRMFVIAGVFAFFQLLMPMIGWVCVRTILDTFTVARRFVPWIAFALLAFIGGKMIWEGLHPDGEQDQAVSNGNLLVQGIATSIDALSVGLTMAELSWVQALSESLIIGAMTLGICLCGLLLGKKVGAHFSEKSSILGGTILILIGLEIVISHLLGS